MPLRNLRSGATRTCFPPERRVPHSERARFVNLQRKNSAEKPKVQHNCIPRLDSAITYNAGGSFPGMAVRLWGRVSRELSKARAKLLRTPQSGTMSECRAEHPGWISLDTGCSLPRRPEWDDECVSGRSPSEKISLDTGHSSPSGPGSLHLECGGHFRSPR